MTVWLNACRLARVSGFAGDATAQDRGARP